jgi:hypothetical protein
MEASGLPPLDPTKTPSFDGRTIARTLRRGRRALSGWRDGHVLIDLLGRKARRKSSSAFVRSPVIRDLPTLVAALRAHDAAIDRARGVEHRERAA